MSTEGADDDGEVIDDYRGDESVTDDYQETDRLVDRRGYLKLASAAATAAGMATLTAGVSGASSLSIEFDRVLDAVDDLGLDPTGTEPVESKIESALSAGTCIEFPDGEYQIGSYLDLEDVSNVGLRAASGASPTLVPGTKGADLPGGWLLIRITGSNFEFGGFDIDFQQDGYYGEIVCDATSGDLHVHDIRRLGLVPGDIDGIWLTNMSSDGVGVVENVNMRDGAREGTSATGLQVRASHAGEMLINDCDLWHFPSKGIYASSPAVGGGGTVHVDGGTFKNNNDCDVRIGSSGSTVRNIVSIKTDSTQGETVTWENPIPFRHWDGRTDIIQTRSIRLKDGRNVLIDGCEFKHEIGEGVGVITAEGSHDGGTTIRDCRLQVDNADIHPILLDEGGGQYTIENVSITGSGGRGVGIRVLSGNDGTEVRNSCLSLTGDGQNGVEVYGADDCQIADTNISVPGEAVVFNNVTGQTSGLTYGDSCPAPDLASSDDTSDSTTDSTQEQLPNTLEIQGTGVETNYAFTVDGDVAADADANDLEQWDTVSSPNVEGWVTTSSQVDTYRFSGDVTEFTYIKGEADLTLNGQSVTAAELEGGSTDTTDSDTLPREITVRGSGTPANYAFAVDGDLSAGPESNLESWDKISGVGAEGWVTTTSQEDTYRFSGDIAYVDFYEGEAEVLVDGQPVSPADVGYPKTITIDGYDSASYTIGVSETIVPHSVDGDLSPDATVDGNVGETIGDGRHAFVYDGAITQFSLDGEAAVYVDGTQVDPDDLDDLAIDPLPNEIVFDGTGAANATDYAFGVTGEVERSPDLGSAEVSDTIVSGRVAGSVDDDIDGFRFTGELTSLSAKGTVSVRFGESDA